MRAGAGALAFRPQLPSGITRLTFRIRYRDRGLRVSITPGSARYELLAGEPLAITHHGEQVLLAGQPVVLGIPPVPFSIPPGQPEGRAPLPHAQRERATERNQQALPDRPQDDRGVEAALAPGQH
jgi:alpha,alpha-trehalose phosphorylase